MLFIKPAREAFDFVCVGLDDDLGDIFDKLCFKR